MSTDRPKTPVPAEGAQGSPDTEWLERTEPSNPANPTDPYLGSTVADRYKIISRLGEGGMGVVYLAEHVIIEKRVAIKILSDDFARKSELVARFMQEAKAASKIGHENIVDITDFGETESGSVFFVMEHLDGNDLAHHIRESSPFTVERARGVILQVCRALAAAHQKGIIHRDLKPENIFLIDREDRQDFVKILDFGIAKMSSVDEPGHRLTRTGMIFGTPEYMSPEQARGDRPDHRVDIYATGCILYEMLTGHVPFSADTFMGVLTKHMFENVPPLSERAPEVSPEIAAVVMRALEKDREKRYQTMKHLALALEAAAGGNPQDAWLGEASGTFQSRDHSAVFYSKYNNNKPPSSQPQPPMEELTDGSAIIPRPSTWKIWVSLAGAALLGLIIWGATKSDPPQQHVAKGSPPVVDKEIAAPPDPSPAPPEATSHQITIISRPSGAEVWSGADQVGITPMTLMLAHSELESEYTLKKRGYNSQTIKVKPDGKREIQAELAPQRRPSGPPKTPAASPSTTHTPSGLKDPFAN